MPTASATSGQVTKATMSHIKATISPFASGTDGWADDPCECRDWAAND